MRLTRKAFPLIAVDGARPAYDDYIVQHRRWASEQEGAPHFALPAVGAPYPRSSLNALQAMKWVDQYEPERMESFEFAVFESFFGRLEDISDTGQLHCLASWAGLDEPDEMRRAIEAGEMLDAVMRDYREAIQKYRVTGIPTVVVPGREPLVGAVPAETYAQALREAARKENAP